ncbi:MAG: DUF1648 domain-containing protein [Terriglobia bacterium]
MPQKVVALALAAYSYFAVRSAMPRLPARIATHFNWSGEPNGWGTPDTLWILLGAQVLGTALILAIPALGRRAPQLVNLGTRRLSDYPPEARERIMPLLEDMCGYLAVLFSLLFTVLIRELIRTALSPGTHPSFWPIGGFLAAIAVLVVYYLWRMNRAAGEIPSPGSAIDAS